MGSLFEYGFGLKVKYNLLLLKKWDFQHASLSSFFCKIIALKRVMDLGFQRLGTKRGMAQISEMKA